MAIAKHKPVVSIPAPQLPKAEPDNYKSIVYDDKYVPLTSLLSYAEGMPWTVTYYSQVLSKHNDLRSVDSAQPSIYQQYHKVVDMEIRVSSDLSTSHDSNSAITDVTGSALIYPFIIPNTGDHFVSDAGSSRKGIYVVTNVTRKTLNKDSMFEIEYRLLGFVVDQEELYSSIEERTIRTYYFDKGRLVEGLQPYLKEEDYKQVTSLGTKYRELIQYYFKTFFNRSYMTLVIPGQHEPIYDSFLVNYLLKIIDVNDAPELRSFRILPTDNDEYLNQPQFWDLLLNKDYQSIRHVNRYMGLVNKKFFNRSTYLAGLSYSNVNYIVYPEIKDKSTKIGFGYKEYVISYTSIQNTESDHLCTFAQLPVNQFKTVNKTYRLYDQLLVDDSYVLSDNFYNETEDMTVLEIMVKDYLKMNTLNLDMLEALYKGYRLLSRLEQFYYGPILITLIKEARRGTYT